MYFNLALGVSPHASGGFATIELSSSASLCSALARACSYFEVSVSFSCFVRVDTKFNSWLMSESVRSSGIMWGESKRLGGRGECGEERGLGVDISEWERGWKLASVKLMLRG